MRRKIVIIFWMKSCRWFWREGTWKWLFFCDICLSKSIIFINLFNLLYKKYKIYKFILMGSKCYEPLCIGCIIWFNKWTKKR